MKKHQIIFCEMKFWTELSKLLTEIQEMRVDIFSETEEKHVCAQKIWKSIKSATNINFDDEDLFRDTIHNDNILRKLWKLSEESYNQGFPVISYSKEDFEKSQHLSDNELVDAPLFLASDDKNIVKVNKYGILCINANRWLTAKMLFEDFGPEIKKNQMTNWNTLLSTAKHGCSSMIVIDNYILKNNKIKGQNLYPILDILLPRELCNRFHLSIFFELSERKIEDEYTSIIEEIKKIRPKLTVDLTLYKCASQDFHDRAIITNYMWIESIGGFDLLKRQGLHSYATKDTSLRLFFPYIQDNIASGIGKYENFIDKAKKLRAHNSLVGSDQNRILDY